MAMFWQYTKGLNGNDTSGHAPLYTFLDYKEDAIDSENKLPNIVLSPKNSISATGSKDFGHILTQGGTSTSDIPFTYQTIYSWLHFKGNGARFTNTSGNLGVDINCDTNGQLIFSGVGSTNININDSINHFNIATSTDITGNLGVTGVITAGKYANIGGATSHTENGDISGKNIYADTLCEALYFNARSDRRAKTDIQPLLINALNIINDTQLYSFHYKDMDTPSIGIIAQDVQDININGFKLVDNENASGQDMDYMTIHESKLVYILWKAIQEQQKEIDELKAELKKRG